MIKPSILVVDDEEKIGHATVRMLKYHGLDACPAISAVQAMKMLQAVPFNLIISDLNMPGMDGVALLAYVKENHPTVSFVMATAFGTVGHAVETLKAGASDYLIKPYGSDELIFTVNRCLREQQMDTRLKELEELNRLKSEFVSNVSHELRTPLSAMGGALDLLNQDFSGKLEGVQAQLFSVVLNDFERLSHIIRNVLDYSRLEQGKLKLLFQPVDLQNVVDRSLHELSPLIRAKRGLTTSIDVPPEKVVARADREQLVQVFNNLINNAIKFTQAPGHVRVTLEDQGELIACGVEDSGIGIAPEYREKIFERFFQVDGSPTRSAGGTGIGLAIVKAIIEAHGGMIWVAPKEGAGTLIKFTLPKSGNINEDSR